MKGKLSKLFSIKGLIVFILISITSLLFISKFYGNVDNFILNFLTGLALVIFSASLVYYPLFILNLIIKHVKLPNSPINKYDFSMVLFTFYLIAYFHNIFNSAALNDALWNWVAPKFSVFTFIATIITLYTLLYRIKNKTLKDTFSLYKFMSSKNISVNKKVGLVFVLFMLFYSIFNLDFNSYSVRRTYLVLTKLVYSSVMYLLIYYVTFYVEMLSVINDEEEQFLILPEIKAYKSQIDHINLRYSESVQEQLKSERMKSDLITNVSHDIRTPLTSIISYVDLLCEKQTLDDEAKEYIQVLNKKSWRLNNLIDDLMDATRLSSGNKEVELEKLDLLEVIPQIEADFEEKIEARGLEVVTNYVDLPTYIYADSNSTSRVLENIYGNIVKYALPNTRVYISIVISEFYITLTFKNISKDALNIEASELMERFVRAEESRSTAGNGLGLYIAQSLMQLMNGKLQVDINGDLFVSELSFQAYSENVNHTNKEMDE